MHPCHAPRCKGTDGNAVLIQDAEAFCGYHLGKVTSALVNLTARYTDLDVMLDVVGRAAPDNTGAKIAGRLSAPIPLNIAARALQDDMVGITARAENGYRRLHNLPPAPRRGREFRRLRGQVSFLHPVLAVVVVECPAIGVELLRIDWHARQVLGLVPLVHRLPAPCPECDALALRRDDGASWVKCHNCGLTFGEDEYEWLCKVLADANGGVKR